VIDALRGVPAGVQRTVEVFVAECRPKSPHPYDDAAAIAESLKETFFSVTVCPDVVAVHLLATQQISKVLMGTHAVYVASSGERYAYVNSCGSLAIAAAAERFDVPVIVLGEELKLENVEPDEAADHLHEHHEEDLLAVATGLSELQTLRGPVRHINIGYDLEPVTPNTTLVVPDALARS
jgi:translation initiation factor 2B subunit (eIF-2B alpha/beta/delta family)